MASANDSDGYFGTLQSSGSQKRTHILSNGQVIWDFAGNVWEHVNKANTFDGKWHTDAVYGAPNACGWVGRYSFFGNDTYAQCGYINGYTYSSIWPITPNMNSNNGVGRVYSSNVVDVIFIRWSYFSWWGNSGIYTLYLIYNNIYASSTIGFRCAK